MKYVVFASLLFVSHTAFAEIDYSARSSCLSKADAEYRSCAASCRVEFADPRRHAERMECVQACGETLSEMNQMCGAQND